MSDQRNTACPWTESAANIHNNAYENRSALDADAPQDDNHNRTGDLPETQHALASVSDLRTSERGRRELAVRFARASVGLEGFVPSRRAEMDAQRFIEGQISLSEFVNAT